MSERYEEGRAKDEAKDEAKDGVTRRRFLERIGRGALAGGAVAGALGCSRAATPTGAGKHGGGDGDAAMSKRAGEGTAASKPAEGDPPRGGEPTGPEPVAAETARPEPVEGKVAHRMLGKTGLSVSEIGFGGHSWAYKRVPDGTGKLRRTTIDEAVEMVRAGLEMGVNFFDSCTPTQEHTVPGEVIKRLGRRDDIVVSARCCHRMKGREADKQEVYRFVDERLKMWQTDRFDILMLSNTENDTKMHGYWDMSYCIEALDKLKEQGKVRFAGFGSHFTPELFLQAFEKYGAQFDLCSMPYNVRHRAAEEVMPAAEKAGLGIVTIKPFARGSLLKKRDLAGADAGLPRDMVAFVLENALVDCCICGVHTMAHVQENMSASWTRLTPDGRKRLTSLGARTACREYEWLERGWISA